MFVVNEYKSIVNNIRIDVINASKKEKLHLVSKVEEKIEYGQQILFIDTQDKRYSKRKIDKDIIVICIGDHVDTYIVIAWKRYKSLDEVHFTRIFCKPLNI